MTRCTSDGRAVINYEGEYVDYPDTEKVDLPAFKEEELENASFNNPGLGDDTEIQKLKLEIGLLPNSSFFTINALLSSLPPSPLCFKS